MEELQHFHHAAKKYNGIPSKCFRMLLGHQIQLLNKVGAKIFKQCHSYNQVETFKLQCFVLKLFFTLEPRTNR